VELNPEQQRAVEHGGGPLLVLAGAGTGKTRVLVHRILRLVERRVWPRQILAVTFTNKAAGEMRERLRQMMGADADRMWIGTFHATCARLLRMHGEHIGLRRDFTIFDDDDQMRILSALIKEHGVEDAISARTIGNRIDRAKNRGEDPAAPRPFGGSQYADEFVRTLYPLYQQRLQRENGVDFNDLLLKVLELADDPDAGPELAAAFRHVLVDEFQDTNVVQYRLVRHLVKGTRNLTVVGDDDQSIYSWRGAEPRNLLDFDRDFPDAMVIKLEQNYRSTQHILGAANGVIAENTQRHPKALWSERAGGDQVLWEETADERAEADFVARGIAGLVDEAGMSWGDICVLYRTHAQSRVFEEQLRRYRIEYRVVGGVSFFQRREIKDVLAYLRLLVNPAADSCFERVINVPARGIGATTIDRIKAHARVADLSMLEAARSCAGGAVSGLGPQPRKKLAQFGDLVAGLRDVQAAGASVAEVIIQTIERSGYRERLEIEDTPEARDRVANLAELVNMASNFDDETEGKGTLSEFVERLALSSANDSADGRGKVVTMMTIHAAKGLEFPVVFLCGMEDGLFPSMREREDGDDDASLEEERRLAYVAMTRARDRLILTSARTRRHWGEMRMNRSSRFLDAIPREHLAIRGRPGMTARPSAQSRIAAYQRQPARRSSSSPDNFDDLDQSSTWSDDVPIYDHAVAGRSAIGEVEPGARVSHASFGTGRVVETRGQGRDRKLVIDFPDVGLKTVLARFVARA
jgi:DNA helicase-2/ATP-dependent DNA helicase PcrA